MRYHFYLDDCNRNNHHLFIYFFINQQMFKKSLEEALNQYGVNISENTKDSSKSDSKSTEEPDSKNTEEFDSENTEELLSLRMQYLESISEMHHQATNRDLFIFIYGLLSSGLIGISVALVKKMQTQQENLSKKFTKLNDSANQIGKRLNTHDRFILIDSVSQCLSDALTYILGYNIALGNENLVQFKQSIHQAAKKLDCVNMKKIKTDHIDSSRKRLGTIINLYESASKKPGTEITKTHKKYIQKDFDSIKTKLYENTNH